MLLKAAVGAKRHDAPHFFRQDVPLQHPVLPGVEEHRRHGRGVVASVAQHKIAQNLPGRNGLHVFRHLLVNERVVPKVVVAEAILHLLPRGGWEENCGAMLMKR